MHAKQPRLSWGACRGVVVLGAMLILLILPGNYPPRANASDAPAPGGGGTMPVVVRVEEDWCLVLNEPSQEQTAPQFHTVMSPFGHADAAYAQVSWNYRELPDFEAGGLQLQAWGPDFELGFRDDRQDTLSTDAETVTWTQALETNGQYVRFTIQNGASQTWGSFGGPTTHIDIPLALASLQEYSPAVSQENSWITFGTNRVTSLVITQVRRYGANGELWVNTTPVVVYQMEAGE